VGKEMITSNQTIEYIKKNLDKKNYLSLSISGSMPANILPKGDLDIFLIMRKDRQQQCLENLNTIMRDFVKRDKKVTYSFFRGPIKYAWKGLISFSIYNDDKPDQRESIFYEDKQFLKNVMKKSKTIGGVDIKDILKKRPILNDAINDAKIKKLKSKYKTLLKKNYIKYPQWKKIEGKWALVSNYRYAGKWYREYMINYYEKWNTKK
jgi:hypothetical protein